MTDQPSALFETCVRPEPIRPTEQNCKPPDKTTVKERNDQMKLKLEVRPDLGLNYNGLLVFLCPLSISLSLSLFMCFFLRLISPFICFSFFFLAPLMFSIVSALCPSSFSSSLTFSLYLSRCPSTSSYHSSFSESLGN